MSNKIPKPKAEEEVVTVVTPDAPPEPTEAELIARRQAALAEYGIKDERNLELSDE